MAVSDPRCTCYELMWDHDYTHSPKCASLREQAPHPTRSAEDEFPLVMTENGPDTPRETYDAMCDEIDRLRIELGRMRDLLGGLSIDEYQREVADLQRRWEMAEAEAGANEARFGRAIDTIVKLSERLRLAEARTTVEPPEEEPV